MNHPENKNQLRNLNFWQLASILGSAMGFPAMLIGGQVAQQYGAGTAIISIFLGNAILWVIGLGIVSMSDENNDAIENIRNYLGKPIGLIVSLVLVLAFLTWFTIQVKGASIIGFALDSEGQTGSLKLWYGVLLGIAVSLLSLGGIRLISKVCVPTLPVLILFSIIMIITSSKPVIFKGTWGFSALGTLSIMFLWLPGIVNLPTFFRHSTTKPNSFFALSLMTGFHVFFQISAVLSGLSGFLDVKKLILESNHTLYIYFMVCFILLFFLCINLVNIYFASAAWDLLVSFYRGSRKYLAIGLLGTAAYVLFDLSSPILKSPMLVIEKTITSFISNLGVVLLIDFLISTVVKHRLRSYEKFWSSMSWMLGCVMVLVIETNMPSLRTFSFLAGMVTSTLAFLVILFIEETVWAIKNLQEN